MFKYLKKKFIEKSKISKLFLKKQIFRYLLIAVFAYLVDFLSYVIVLLVTNNIIVSNLFAKFATSITGYIFHTTFTYKKKLFSSFYSFFLYFATVIIYTPLSTIILIYFSEYMNLYYAKFFSDIVLFIIIYIFTSKIIFKKGL